MLSRTQMFQQENSAERRRKQTCQSVCGRKLGTTLRRCFYWIGVLGPTQTVVIEESTKILTEAQRSSKHSISGRTLSQ